MPRLYHIAGLCLALTLTPAFLAAQTTADSAASVARGDTLLVPDSSFSDYLLRRERFNYPVTTRKDPFDSPFGRARADIARGPGLDEIELTGVLYSPDGLSVAILALPGGDSFLLHEGDYLGTAVVSLIEMRRVHFRISEYGVVRTLVKDLKPLVEGEDVTTRGKAGGDDRRQESGPSDGESGDDPR